MTLFAQNTIIKTDKCTLQEADAFEETKLCVIETRNEEVQVVFSVRGSEFFDHFVIMTAPKLTNLSDKVKYIAYNLAFFDKRGDMVACTSSNADLKKGAKDMQSGASMPAIPPSMLDKITSYKATIYVLEGKKE